jgi:hypothetical protein
MECSEALKIKNMVNSGENTSSVSSFKKAMAMSKARECVLTGNGTLEVNTRGTVTPNKGWYNARAREGEQGAWTGSMSPTGTTVIPVKNCGNAGQNPNGTCRINSQATPYNYVE